MWRHLWMPLKAFICIPTLNFSNARWLDLLIISSKNFRWKWYGKCIFSFSRSWWNFQFFRQLGDDNSRGPILRIWQCRNEKTELYNLLRLLNFDCLGFPLVDMRNLRISPVMILTVGWKWKMIKVTNDLVVNLLSRDWALLPIFILFYSFISFLITLFIFAFCTIHKIFVLFYVCLFFRLEKIIQTSLTL